MNKKCICALLLTAVFISIAVAIPLPATTRGIPTTPIRSITFPTSVIKVPPFGTPVISNPGNAVAVGDKATGQVWVSAAGDNVAPLDEAMVSFKGSTMPVGATAPEGYFNRLQGTVWIDTPSSSKLVTGAAALKLKLEIFWLGVERGIGLTDDVFVDWGPAGVTEKPLSPWYSYVLFDLREGLHSYTVSSRRTEGPEPGNYYVKASIVSTAKDDGTAASGFGIGITKIELRYRPYS